MSDDQMSASGATTSILVTGGTGMVGTYLLHLLVASGYQNIRAIYRPGSHLEATSSINHLIDWIECDLLDQVGMEKVIQGIAQVYHCAGVISFRKKDRPYMMQVNMNGTANLVNLSLRFGVERLLHVSSVAALGRTKPGQSRTEKDYWERSPFNTFYGLSKFQGEQEVWRGQAEGLEVVIVNPTIILGAHNWEEGPGRFFPMIDKGFRFYPAGGTGLVDVRDVVTFMKMLMESNISGERYILNAGTISYQSFFQKIALALDVPAPKVSIGPAIQQLAWRLAWLQEKLSGKASLISRETAAQSSYTYYYPADKSQKTFNFSYRNIDQTIQEMAQTYQQWKANEGFPRLDLS